MNKQELEEKGWWPFSEDGNNGPWAAAGAPDVTVGDLEKVYDAVAHGSRAAIASVFGLQKMTDDRRSDVALKQLKRFDLVTFKGGVWVQTPLEKLAEHMQKVKV